MDKFNAGDLVECGERWGIVRRAVQVAIGWVVTTDEFQCPVSNADGSEAVKLLCRAGDMATCWAELQKLPGVTRVGHMHFLSATLPGKATACPQLLMWQEGVGHIYLRADLRYFYPEDDARNDQIRQWLGALRAYIAACKERK